MPNAEEWFSHGMQLLANNRKAEAVLAFQNCLMLNPRHHGGWANRGALLHEFGNHFDAVHMFNQAQTIKEDASVLNNRGVAWQELGAIENAVADYRRALQLDPAMVLASNNIGNLLSLLGETEKSRDQFTHSLNIKPDCAEARLFRGMQNLNLGELEQGFEDFEARWASGQIPVRLFEGRNGRIPQWNGEGLDGKRLYLYGEQGLGDQVQFIRYAKAIKDRWPGAYVAVEVGLAVTRLLRNVEGVDELVIFGEEIKSDFDYVCPMLSAPRVLKTTLDTIPAERQYIYPDPYRAKVWKRDLAAYKETQNGNKLVGLCWSGLSRPLLPMANKIDAKRSTDLGTFAPLFQIPGVTFVSLQHGGRSEQAKNPPPNAPILDNTEFFHDFSDTAALMANLDLVISVDTAVVHVAAALGKPTWVLSRFDGCWRWHFGKDPKRTDSPWYPTVRVFRQPGPGNWAGMMKEVEHALRVFLAGDVGEPVAYQTYRGNEPLTLEAAE